MSAMRGVMRELFAPLADGAEGMDGWRVLDWDDEQGLCLTLARDGAHVLIELEARDDARPCYARTRRFDVTVRRVFAAAGAALAESERRAVDRVVALVAAREASLPAIERPAVSRRTVVREIRAERVLVREGAGQYYLNPYVGCMIGCEFCYVAERADLSRALAGLPAVPWGRYVDVKIDAPDVLRREVRRLPPGPVRLSPILTDPYQPIERRYRITRRCLEVLLDAGFTPVVLTRAARVLDDLDLLARFPAAAVGLSIPTDDDRERARFEPGADPIEERFDALARLHAAGIRTFGVVQPMLPMDPEALARRMAPHVRYVRIDRMHAMERARPLYAGCPHAATDAFFDATGDRLRRAFAAAGVPADDLDDMHRLAAPARVAARADVKIGFACNNRCRFCAQGSKRREVGLLPAADVADRLRRAYRPGRGLVLTGGEPTIRKDLVALVAVARACGYSPIQIQTNGRMLAYRQLVDRLVRAGVTEISPALHGPNADVHDALTRAPGSYQQTVDGIANAIAAGAAVVTNTVVVRPNLPHLGATVGRLAALGVRRAQLALVHPVGTAAEEFDAMVPPIGEAAAAVAAAIETGRRLGVTVVAEALPPCLLPGLEDAVVEARIPDTTVVDLDGEPFSFSDWRRTEGKAKGPPCRRCARAAACEGPWREYPARFGWDDYRPYEAAAGAGSSSAPNAST